MSDYDWPSEAAALFREAYPERRNGVPDLLAALREVLIANGAAPDIADKICSTPSDHDPKILDGDDVPDDVDRPRYLGR